MLGLLRDYLSTSLQQRLADTACFMLGGVLAQQEHMLRATRMEHWPLDAVMHMDALVQLYSQLLSQVGGWWAYRYIINIYTADSAPTAPPIPYRTHAEESLLSRIHLALSNPSHLRLS